MLDKLESDRLTLTPPSMDWQNAMLLAVVESQNTLRQFLPWVPNALTEQESINDMQKAIDNFERFENELRFGLIEKTSGQLVGVIGLVIRDKSVPFFEIGYWLRSSCAGKGYMTEAVTRLEHYAFTELSANRVEIRVAETNLKSQAVAERCQYLLEGMLVNECRLPSGALSNTLIYAKSQQTLSSSSM